MVEHILCTTCVSICVLCILCMDSNSVFAVEAAAATCCNNYMLVFAQLLLCNLILWIGFLTLSPYFCDYWFFGWISINVINLTYNLLNAVLSGFVVYERCGVWFCSHSLIFNWYCYVFPWREFYPFIHTSDLNIVWRFRYKLFSQYHIMLILNVMIYYNSYVLLLKDSIFLKLCLLYHNKRFKL